MRIILAFSLSFLLYAEAFCQQHQEEKKDTLTHEKFITMVNFNRDQSYIAASQGFGNLEPLIFEGKLSPSYFLSNKGRRWALLANPQVQMRMLNKPSVPIESPSYKVYLTYYQGIDFWRRGALGKIFYEDALWFATVAHHSNGQAGAFRDSLGNINLQQGSFAVNFIQLGVSTFSSQPMGAYYSLRELKFHAEIYPSAFPIDWYDENLKGQYGFYRGFVSYNILGIQRKNKTDWFNMLLKQSSIELQTGWIFDDLRGYSAVNVEHRLIVDAKYKYYPNWIAEFAFFVRYYYGQDYYNIHYETQLSVLSFGLTSNIVKMNNAVKYIGKRKKNNTNINSAP